MVTYPGNPVIREHGYALFDHLGAKKMYIDGTEVTSTSVSGMYKIVVAAGTASATDVTVAAIAVGDELLSVIAINESAVPIDRTSEYTVGAGKLVKAAGTNETGHYLLIFYVNNT
jgi:hypothetical protein